MKKSPALPLGAIALLLLATWAVMDSMGPAASTAAQASAANEGVRGAGGALPDSDAASAAAKGLPAHAANAVIDVERTKVEVQQQQAQRVRDLPFRLQVVGKDGITAVANAEVFFIRNTQGQFPSSYAAARVHVGKNPSTLAKREDAFRTDPNGFVNLPAPTVQTQIIARSGSRYGQLFGASSRDSRSLGSTAHTLPIQEDALFTITAMDVNGIPAANKTVALFHKSRTSWVASLLAQTDEHGVARFFGMRSHLLYGVRGEYGFGFDTPGLAPEIGPLAFEDLPHSAQLTSTQTASLRIHFFDRFGEDYEGNAWVQLTPTSTPFRGWHNRDLRPDGGSTIEFTEVNPGTTFDLKVGWEGHGSKVYSIVGPAQPGETADINITSEQERAILPLRLLSEDGRVFADVAVDLRLEVHERKIREVRSYPLHTNLAGEAVAIFPLTNGRSNRRQSTADHVAIFSCTDPQSGILLQGELNLGPTPDPITHEQVDLVLTKAPVLAAGFVRTADGQPAVHALISYGMVHVFTDAEGHFVFHTPNKPPFKTLAVSWRQQRLRRIPFTFGAEDLEIILENRDYRVEGKIFLPEELRQQSFNLRFVSDEKPREISFVKLPRGQTSFAMELASDKLGRLQLLSESGNDVIASLFDLRPAAKNETQDQRLQPWHLQDQIAFAELDVQMNGKAVESFRLIDKSPGYDRKFTEIRLGDRVLYVLSNATPALAFVDAGRYSVQEFRATSFMLKPGSQVVHVEPSILLFFAFPEQYKLPGYAGLYINLINPGGEKKWCEYFDPTEWEDEFEELGADSGRTKLTFAHAGTWSLTAKLVGTDANGIKHSIPLPIGDLSGGVLPLSVQESSTGNEILLDISQDDLDAALKKAGWVY